MSFTCSSSSPSMSLASTSDASLVEARLIEGLDDEQVDRKSTRLNSSHGYISYAVFCLKKKKMTDFSVRLFLPRNNQKSTIFSLQHFFHCMRSSKRALTVTVP